MPPRISFTDFNRRLFVAGGREQVPENALRRARGIAPELTGSVQSAFPSKVLYGIRALNLIRFYNLRYQFDGSILYKEGVNIASGFNGNRAALVTMPPASGLQDYLFLAGAGKLVKVAPDSTVTNWGIDRPPDQLAVTKVAQDIITLDTFDSHHGNWTGHNCALTDDNVLFQFGTGSMKMTPSEQPWTATTTVGYPQDLSKFSNGDISLPSDLISIWCNFRDPTKTVWMWLMFDVNDGTFKKDYYLAVIQLVATTNNTRAAGANAVFTPDASRWTQIAVPKSAFQRIGSKLNLDWSNVVAVRIEGGWNVNNFLPVEPVWFDNLQLIGGAPLGAGPAAISGGSEYEYYATFLNLVTGNRSNPQPDSAKVFGVALQKASVSQIPTSTDPQVGARELWRTSAENFGGSQTAFLLDTIYDNTTTTYTDVTADTSIPITQTPWIASAAYNTGQLVDGGNGYYFKVTAGGGGNTGATVPNWIIPQSTWVALGTFLINTTIAPLSANGHFFKVTVAGVSGRSTPNWAAGGTIIDGTVTWVDQGVQVTVDNALTWTFQGINSTPVLGNQAIQFDNIKPFATIGDAVGPWQGSMVWTRDSATGSRGNIYFSPPGRAEGMGLFINVSTDDDPTQKAVIWQEQLWLLTTNAIYRLDGAYPNIVPTKIYDHSGGNFPFTVVSDKRGIYYRDQDALHGMNYAGNPVVGFEQLATILRNQPAENLPAFAPTFAGFAREEIYWSDEKQVTLAMNLKPETGHAWRSFNVAMTAIYYEEETGEIVASWNGATGLWEHPDFTIVPGDDLRVTHVSIEIAMPNI